MRVGGGEDSWRGAAGGGISGYAGGGGRAQREEEERQMDVKRWGIGVVGVGWLGLSSVLVFVVGWMCGFVIP